MPPKKLRILCLGASLVAGFTSMGAVYHPFSNHVVKLLNMTMPGVDVEIVVDGVPGDRVTTGTFVKRMQKHFAEGCQPFDWTVVLGATNDLAAFISIDDIMERFKEVWGIPLAHGSKVLALTVPKASFDSQSQSLVEKRNALNQRIKDYNANGFHVLDLHDALPYDSTHAKYWDDAVHFTPAGYDLIGDKIGTVITSLIVAERAQGTL